YLAQTAIDEIESGDAAAGPAVKVRGPDAMRSLPPLGRQQVEMAAVERRLPAGKLDEARIADLDSEAFGDSRQLAHLFGDDPARSVRDKKQPRERTPMVRQAPADCAAHLANATSDCPTHASVIHRNASKPDGTSTLRYRSATLESAGGAMAC